MGREITIDEDVYEALKSRAEPFEDTPSTVLRRVLGLAEAGRTLEQDSTSFMSATRNGAGAESVSRRRTKRDRARGPRTRAKKGSLLPAKEYEIPILKALGDMGGQAQSKDVVAAVGEMLQSRLTETDREELSTGGIRWENRVHFTRLRLKEEGLLAAESPRGVWELSDSGRARLDSVGSR